MGFFDGYLSDPESTANATGPSPGWLGPMLAAQPGASQGFDAPAPMNAAPMNSPVANGGALFDGFGNLLPPSPAAAPSQAAPSFGDRLTAALTGAATARGLIPTLASGIGGFMSPGAASVAAPTSGGLSAGDRATAALMNVGNARGFVPALAGAVVGATSGQRIAPPAGYRNGGGVSDTAAPIAGVGPNAGMAPINQAPAAAPDVFGRARAAIAAGAPRAAVIQRLQQLGIDPKGL